MVLKLENPKIKSQLIWIFISVIFLVLMIYIYIGLRGFIASPYGDLYLRWKESAYLFRGINPYDITNGLIEPIPSIGSLRRNEATVPWAFLLSNIFLPGFLSYENALIWYILFVIFFLIFFVRNLYFFLLTKLGKIEYAILGILIVMTSFGWVRSFVVPNYSFVSNLLLIQLIILDKKKHSFYAILLLTLSMVKPQIASLFFISLFLKKHFKITIVSFILVILSWLIVSSIINVDMITLLLSIFEIGADYSETAPWVYYGFFHFLLPFTNSYFVIIFSAIFGVISVLVYSILNNSKNDIIYFATPSVFSLIWMYNYSNEVSILGIFGISLLFFQIKIGFFSKSSLVISLASFTLLMPHLSRFYDNLIYLTSVRLIWLFTLYIVNKDYKSFNINLFDS
jgi:hypothetical protein